MIMIMMIIMMMITPWGRPLFSGSCSSPIILAPGSHLIIVDRDNHNGNGLHDGDNEHHPSLKLEIVPTWWVSYHHHQHCHRSFKPTCQILTTLSKQREVCIETTDYLAKSCFCIFPTGQVHFVELHVRSIWIVLKTHTRKWAWECMGSKDYR